jgi:hypothetical protein
MTKNTRQMKIKKGGIVGNKFINKEQVIRVKGSLGFGSIARASLQAACAIAQKNISKVND